MQHLVCWQSCNVLLASEVPLRRASGSAGVQLRAPLSRNSLPPAGQQARLAFRSPIAAASSKRRWGHWLASK